MRSQGSFLSPGFCLTVTAVPNKYLFSQLEGQFKRVTPARLKIIDILNRGFDGNAEALALECHKQHEIPKSATGKFLDALAGAGFLMDASADPDYADESATAPVSIST